MTTIEDLAQTISNIHGIDSMDAARDVVRVHIDQIADDVDLYDPQTRELTDAGTALVTEAVARSYAQGFVSTHADNLLALIDAEAGAIEAAEKEIAERTGRRDELIRAALRTELPRAAIASAAGIKEARLYQIRDGRR
jgi:hypothetical protein